MKILHFKFELADKPDNFITKELLFVEMKAFMPRIVKPGVFELKIKIVEK